MYFPNIPIPLTVIQTIIDFFSRPEIQILISRIKIFSAILSILFFYGIVYLLIKTQFIKSKVKIFEDIFITRKQVHLPKKQINKSWLKILKRLEKNYEAEWKLALIEADKLFDDLLKRMDYQGKDQGARMKQLTQAQFSNLNELWEAHKTRNRLVHEPEFHINQAEVFRLLKAYEKAFRDLALLE